MKGSKASAMFNGTGRRKSSVARVWLKPGKGSIIVNGRDSKKYFDTDVTRQIIKEPLSVSGVKSYFDIQVNVHGGGMVSQAGAIRLGLSRALVSSDENLRQSLKKQGFLRCDSRVKERKKYGQKGARAKFQFVKR
jgi:small subunit ribosomal protein S9